MRQPIRGMKTDFGRVSVSASVARTTIVVEAWAGEEWCQRHVLRAGQIDDFLRMVNAAVDRLIRDDQPEAVMSSLLSVEPPQPPKQGA